MTDQEYLNDSSKWGLAQYITLEDVIRNIRLKADDDSYFKHLDRYKASIHGKQIIKELNVSFQKKKKAISLQLPESKIIVYPKYMTDWFRVSVYNSCKKLTELTRNQNTKVVDYLQDHKARFLYDNNGNILEGNHLNLEHGQSCLEVDPCRIIKNKKETVEDFSDSWVKTKKEDGYFEFSEDLIDKLIVIEFEEAGLNDLQDCDIMVHNALERAVETGIKWRVTEGNRNTPTSDVLYWYGQYKKAKRKAENELSNDISIKEIINSVSMRFNN